MPRAKKRIVPDYDNTNPLRGLPHAFPKSHSRFPAVPSGEYASAVTNAPDVDDNPEVVMRELMQARRKADSKRTWRDVIGGKAR